MEKGGGEILKRGRRESRLNSSERWAASVRQGGEDSVDKHGLT
jgi:hypothetical protein